MHLLDAIGKEYVFVNTSDAASVCALEIPGLEAGAAPRFALSATLVWLLAERTTGHCWLRGTLAHTVFLITKTLCTGSSIL